MKNIWTTAAALLFALACQSCEICDQREEVNLDVVMSNYKSSLYFTEIKAEGAQKTIALKDTMVEGNKFSKFVLPVNTNADSTRYIFRGNLGTDTLTIRYKRTFKYESNKCGFNVELEGEYDPKSTFDFPVQLDLGYLCSIGFCEYRKRLYLYLP